MSKPFFICFVLVSTFILLLSANVAGPGGSRWYPGRESVLSYLGHLPETTTLPFTPATIQSNVSVIGKWQVLNDSHLQLMIEKEVTQSGYVSLKAKTKDFGGLVDMAIGFNSEDAKPTEARLKSPHNVTINHSYTCTTDYFDYTSDYFWCYENVSIYNNITHENTSHLELIFEHSFEWGNLPSKTAYWTTQEERQYKDISGIWTPLHETHKGFDLWYIAKNIPMVMGEEREMQFWLDIKWTGFELNSGKYGIAMKPSFETIAQAIANGHFYYIDPEWSQPSKSNRLNISTSGFNQGELFIVNGSSCFSIEGNKQCVETAVSGAGMAVYYNAYDDWTIANDSTELNYYVISGDVASRNSDTLYSDAFVTATYWFNGAGNEALDATGNDNNGTITGATRIIGGVGGYLDFDGSNDVMVIPNSASFAFASDPYTIEFRMKTSETGGSDYQVLHKYAGGNDGIYMSLGNSVAGKMLAHFGDGPNYIAPKWATAINDDNWHTTIVRRNATATDVFTDGYNDFDSMAWSAGSEPFDLTVTTDITIGYKPSYSYLNISLDLLRFRKGKGMNDTEINHSQENYLNSPEFGGLGAGESAPVVEFAPDIVTLEWNESTYYSNQDLVANITVNTTTDTTATCQWGTFKDGVLQAHGNTTINNMTNSVLVTIASADTAVGQVWNVTVTCNNTIGFSSVESIKRTISNSVPTCDSSAQSITIGETAIYTPACSDVDSGDSLTYSSNLTTLMCSGTFDTGTAESYFNPFSSIVGVHNVSLECDDATDQTQCSYILTVENCSVVGEVEYICPDNKLSLYGDSIGVR